jgi:hypothetical protein
LIRAAFCQIGYRILTFEEALIDKIDNKRKRKDGDWGDSPNSGEIARAKELPDTRDTRKDIFTFIATYFDKLISPVDVYRPGFHTSRPRTHLF